MVVVFVDREAGQGSRRSITILLVLLLLWPGIYYQQIVVDLTLCVQCAITGNNSVEGNVVVVVVMQLMRNLGTEKAMGFAERNRQRLNYNRRLCLVG